jgi:uncharacterized protein
MAKRYFFRNSQVLPASREELFLFFSDPNNILKVTPPDTSVKITYLSHRPLQLGSVIEFVVTKLGLPLKWKAEVVEHEPGIFFIDEQRKGPFKFFRHKHAFLPHANGTEAIDEIELEMPLGFIGQIGYHLIIQRDLKRTFEYRRNALAALFANAMPNNSTA